MQQLLLVCVIFGLASRVVANGEGRSRTPRIAVVNSQPFHLEIVAGLVDATAPFRDTTTYFLDPAVFPHGDRNLGFIPWIQDVKCERAACICMHGYKTSNVRGQCMHGSKRQM